MEASCVKEVPIIEKLRIALACQLIPFAGVLAKGN